MDENRNDDLRKLDDAILKKQRELSALAKRIDDKKREYAQLMTRKEETLSEELLWLQMQIDEREEYLKSINESVYRETEEYLREVTLQIGAMTPGKIDSDEDFNALSKKLKDKLSEAEDKKKRIKANTFISNLSYTFTSYRLTNPSDIVYQCLSTLCLQYLDLIIASTIKNPYKIGLDESIKRMVKAVTKVEKCFPAGVKVKVPADYLQAKREEIELAYEIEEYKARKEEERKAILQAQREELAAQREIEREIKRAQKDEQEAQAKLERRRMELAQANSDAEIARLKEYIARLQDAVREAQQRHERALSMAQQTRAGYVYVISNIGSFGEGVYKIGMTRRVEPMERVIELGDASVPFPFDVHAMIWSEDAPTLEAGLHRVFDDRKVNAINGRKEFFRVTLDEVKDELERMGVDAVVIEYPAAVQYRDTLMKAKQ